VIFSRGMSHVSEMIPATVSKVDDIDQSLQRGGRTNIAAEVPQERLHPMARAPGPAAISLLPPPRHPVTAVACHVHILSGYPNIGAAGPIPVARLPDQRRWTDGWVRDCFGQRSRDGCGRTGYCTTGEDQAHTKQKRPNYLIFHISHYSNSIIRTAAALWLPPGRRCPPHDR
jgi:hypothetical protein